MAHTTLSIRLDVARKLKAAKDPGESYSDLLERLLELIPTGKAVDILKSLEPFEGRGIFTAEERERLIERHLPSARKKGRRAAA